MKDSANKEGKRRRKIDLKAKVVTDDNFYEAIKAKEEGEKTTEVGRKRGRPKKSTDKEGSSKKPLAKKPRKAAAYPAIDDEESVEWVEDGSESCSGSEIEDAFFEEHDTTSQTEKGHASSSNEQTKGELENAIKSITEQLDDDKKGQFYCAHYGLRYYWGKVQQVFAPDPEENVESVEMKFLHYRLSGFWDFPKQPDIEIVDAKYLFLGPCTPAIVVGKGFKFDEDPLAQMRFKMIKKHDYYGC